jgi:hypothetical protein
MPPFKFRFRRKSRGRSLEDLWRELARWSGISDLSSPEKIVQAVHKLWQTQTVVFILRDLHEIEQEYLQTFMQAFWKPLTEMAREQPCAMPNHCLLFLVDDHDCRWSVPFARFIDPTWEPYMPLALEKLTRIPGSELDSWIRQEVDTLPSSLTIQDILRNSDEGLPELVLAHICGLYGCDWYEREKEWITH